MAVELPAPVPVADLVARRKRGRYHPSDGYLSSSEVAQAWPAVWRYDAVIRANGVRTSKQHATGTYGTTSWTEYHAGDVQRVADAIADGTAVLEPGWRRDTERGRELQRRASREARRVETRMTLVHGTVALLCLAAFIGLLILGTAYF